MRRPKYHFLTVELDRNGHRHLVTLPGQTFGSVPVPGRCLVKDAKGSTALARAKKAAVPGGILFTTTLRRTSTSLLAQEALPLEGHGRVLYNDVDDAYASYLESLKTDNR